MNGRLKAFIKYSNGLGLAGLGQKLGFFGATRVVQPVGATQAVITDTSTNGAAAAAADLAALKTECEAAGDTLRATVILVNKLRADLVTLGLIKGAA